MERRVKERLIGATILVAIIVLVVPEMLSDPKPAAAPGPALLSAPAPTRHVSVDLTTNKAPLDAEGEALADAASAAVAGAGAGAGTGAGTVELTGASSVAAAAGATNATSAVGTGAPVANSASASVAPAVPVESGVASPISHSAALWAVQLGSFASHAHADALIHQLKTHGFAVYLSTTGAGAQQRYRVRIGPLPDHEAANRMVVKLKSQGQSASVVAPAG